MGFKSQKRAFEYENSPHNDAVGAEQARARGRRTLDEEVRRLISASGVDHKLVDPRRVLASIAIDIEAAAGPRVAACKALLIASGGLPAAAVADDDPEMDELSRRALAIMQRGQPN